MRSEISRADNLKRAQGEKGIAGDEAKELRRDIWEKCLKPHGLPHPNGWEG